MAFSVDEVSLKELIGFIDDYENGMRKNFIGQGIEIIKDCGISGDKKAEIDKAADAFEESVKSLLDVYATVKENIKTFVSDVMGFNAEDYFGVAIKEYNSAKNSKKADVRNKMFKGK